MMIYVTVNWNWTQRGKGVNFNILLVNESKLPPPFFLTFSICSTWDLWAFHMLHKFSNTKSHTQPLTGEF